MYLKILQDTLVHCFLASAFTLFSFIGTHWDKSLDPLPTVTHSFIDFII